MLDWGKRAVTDTAPPTPSSLFPPQAVNVVTGRMANGHQREVRCRKVHLVYYESFLQNATEVVNSMAKAILDVAPETSLQNSRNGTAPSVLPRPKRVHGDQINDFVANPNEVVQHFAETGYSSFSQLFQASGLPHLCPRVLSASRRK